MRWPVMVQAVLVAAAIMVFAIAPAMRAPMLAIPTGATSAATLLDGDVQLLGPGPLARSLVIRSGDPGIFWRALSHGILLVRSDATSCSTGNRLND
ncbi:MAG: hypothetical protein K2Y20_07000 [Sphingomonas sp.]|nr:hypothetical protein [Sphingomonas sp.]